LPRIESNLGLAGVVPYATHVFAHGLDPDIFRSRPTIGQ